MCNRDICDSLTYVCPLDRSRVPEREVEPDMVMVNHDGSTEKSLAATQGDLRELATRLDREGWGLNPVEFMGLSIKTLGPKITLGTAFGKEGCVLIHLIAEAGLPVDLFSLDTGLFFEETYALWRRLEDRYGVKIRAVHPKQTVAEQSETYGDALWERQPNRCCHYRKVMPLREQLKGFDGWVTGVRRTQSAVRKAASLASYAEEHDIVKLNPLVSWSDAQLEAFIETHHIPTNPLHARGYPSIGCWPCTSAVAEGEDSRAGRWRGRSKTECGIHTQFMSHPQ